MNFAQIGIIPHENTTYTLKAESPAEGETLQGLRGAAAAKNQNGFNICVLRHCF